MKIVCHRQALLNGVSLAASVAPKSSTRPILTSLRISADEKESVVQATDLEVAIRTRLREVIVEEPGEVVLTAATLAEILRSIESDETTLRTDGRYCEVLASDAQYKLVTEVPEEFPEVDADAPSGVPVPRAFLEEMFTRTAFAAAKDVGRYAINGVLVEIGAGRIRFVATDGRRLSLCTRELPDATAEVQRAIIPVKGLQECLKGSEGDSTVRIHMEEKRIVFSSAHTDVTTRPVEGEFPAYEEVVPTDHPNRIVVPRDRFLMGIRKASVLASDDVRAVRIAIGKETVEIQAQVEGRGEAKTLVEIEDTNGGEFAADFNPDYIVDYLKVLPSERVAFEFKDVAESAVIKLEGADDGYVVMPITTS